MRRHLVEAKENYPECEEALELLGQLLVIESNLPNWQRPGTCRLDPNGASCFRRHGMNYVAKRSIQATALAVCIVAGWVAATLRPQHITVSLHRSLICEPYSTHLRF